ncbi:MAG: DUF2752 domain-containing protein [Clostridiales bacterium]|nr:DUF2752 domain-containing protein [Clostridiales bacterium]
MKKNNYKLIIIMSSILAMSIYTIFDMKCLVKTYLGIPCLGCGMTRAWIEAINFNFYKAFYYHPLFIMPIFMLILVLLSDKISIKSNIIIWSIIIILFIITYIVRYC